MALDWQLALLLLGLVLGTALFAGGLAGYVRLPKVTAYLLVGVILGPALLAWIKPRHVELFEPLTKLAVALVLFNLGCHFPLVRIRRILRRVLRLSVGELATTFLLVAGGLMLLGERAEAALLLGALALATAPATTILVLKESESEGPVTEYTNSLVALNNLVSIVLFELLFLAILFAEGRLPSPSAELGKLARDLAGSVALGIAGGLITSYAYTLVEAGRRLVLLSAIVALLLGLCEVNGMPYLLTFLAMGVTVANSSDQTREVLSELDRLTGLLCVIFFVTSGAELELDALTIVGRIGFGYLVLRFLGKYLGIRWAAGAGREEPAVRNWLGTSLVAQAGAAIALAAIAVQRTERLDPALHELCLHVQTVILGTVVVFEIIGPILIRQSVLRAGEVPLAHAIHHTTSGIFEPARSVWNRLLIALGRNPWKGRSIEALAVSELMRKNVRGVPQEATFPEVMAHIEHSRDNTYPVVGRNGDLVGVIRYHQLSHALFDPALKSLVRAEDLTTPAGWVLHPDEPVSRAYELFRATKDDCLPVLAREEPYRLVGLARRRDVLRLLIRGQIDSQES